MGERDGRSGERGGERDRGRMRTPRPRAQASASASGSARSRSGSGSGSRQQRQRPRKVGFFGRWYVILLGAVIVLGVLGYFWFYPSMKIAYHEARNERVLGAQLKAVKAYNTQLQQEVQSLETTQGVADYAREQLNLVLKGDHTVIVTRDGKPITSDTTQQLQDLENNTEVKRPFGAWTTFLDRVFGSE